MGEVQSCILAIVTVLSVLSNGLVCAALIKYRQHSTPSTRYVLSLCSCNTATSLLVLPFVFISNLHQSWEFGVPWCSASAFLWLVATCADNATLAVVALDRYLAIVRPMSYSVAGNRPGLMLFGVWIVTLSISAIPLVSGIRLAYEPLHAMCLVRWDDSPAFTISFLTVSFLLPALVMLFCYGHVFRIACSKYKKVQIGTVSALVVLPEIVPPPRTPSARKLSWLSTVLQSPVRGFAVISAILGSFFLLWTPYVVMALFELFGLLSRMAPWQQQVALLASLLSLSSHPFIYGLLNRSIRKNLVLQFCRRSRLQNSVSQQRASVVGLLDYTPALGVWTSRPSLDVIESETLPYTSSIPRKSSDDSGRYSMPSDEGSRTLQVETGDPSDGSTQMGDEQIIRLSNAS